MSTKAKSISWDNPFKRESETFLRIHIPHRHEPHRTRLLPASRPSLSGSRRRRILPQAGDQTAADIQARAASGRRESFDPDLHFLKRKFWIHSGIVANPWRFSVDRNRFYLFYTDRQCCGSGSWIRYLFDPWIRNPGWVKNLDQGSGSGTLIFKAYKQKQPRCFLTNSFM